MGRVDRALQTRSQLNFDHDMAGELHQRRHKLNLSRRKRMDWTGCVKPPTHPKLPQNIHSNRNKISPNVAW
jgi:hypothetical protein